MNYYIFKGREIVKVSFLEWAQWFEIADRTIQKTQIDDIKISTVFCGIDHNFLGNGQPALFETIVFFSDIICGEIRRYASWHDAERGHAEIIRQIQVEREMAGIIVSDSLVEILMKLKKV